MNLHPLRSLLLGSLLLAVPAMAAEPPVSGSLTASYTVLRNGSKIGQATASLQPGEQGQWVYRQQINGTSGLAAALGASTTETSHFRWQGIRPQTITYDYALRSAVKRRQRHMQVDWQNKTVQVREGKDRFEYAAVAGMVERNTTPLAIGLALREGARQVDLPVAVKQKLQTQSFKVVGKENIQVPAGRFDALKVERSDAERGFTAWYAPHACLLPVKLAQQDGGNLVMELDSCQTRP